MIEEKLTYRIIECAIRVHRRLGPGLLESVYRECLCYELNKNSILVEKEKAMPVIYDEVELDRGYRMDLLVENKLVVEIKTVDAFNDVHFQQLLTYLRLGNYRLGLLINFQVSILKNGLKRIINPAIKDP